MHIESFTFAETDDESDLNAYSKLGWDPYLASLKPADSFVIQALNYEPNVHLTSYILVSLMNPNLQRVTDRRAAALQALQAKVSSHSLSH